MVIVEAWLASTTVATVGAVKSLPLRLWVVGGMGNQKADCAADWLVVCCLIGRCCHQQRRHETRSFRCIEMLESYLVCFGDFGRQGRHARVTDRYF